MCEAYIYIYKADLYILLISSGLFVVAFRPGSTSALLRKVEEMRKLSHKNVSIMYWRDSML